MGTKPTRGPWATSLTWENSSNDYIITLIKRVKTPLSTLWELNGSLFEKTWIPFTQGYFVPGLVEIGPVVLEKKMKMWKVYRQTDRRTDGRTDGRTDRQTTDDRWSEKLTWAFSSGELIKINYIVYLMRIKPFLTIDQICRTNIIQI